MEGYEQVPKNYIYLYKHKTSTIPKIVFFDKDQKEVTNFEPHTDQIASIAQNGEVINISEAPLYVKTADFESLKKLANKIQEIHNKKKIFTKKITEDAQEYITTIINKSNLLSENDKNMFVKNIFIAVNNLILITPNFNVEEYEKYEKYEEEYEKYKEYKEEYEKYKEYKEYKKYKEYEKEYKEYEEKHKKYKEYEEKHKKYIECKTAYINYKAYEEYIKIYIMDQIFQELNKVMWESLLFSSVSTTIDEVDNHDINIKETGLIKGSGFPKYSLSIDVPNIVFCYNSVKETLSLSKIEIGKEYTIFSEGDQFTIDTTPPITIQFLKHLNPQLLDTYLYIYKVEGNTELSDLIQATPNLDTSATPTPMTLTKCIGDACRKTFRRLTGQSARVHSTGGKRTRKQIYSVRSRGIITLRNASAFRKQKKRGPKGPNSRRKIEHSTSFRNKR